MFSEFIRFLDNDSNIDDKEKSIQDDGIIVIKEIAVNIENDIEFNKDTVTRFIKKEADVLGVYDVKDLYKIPSINMLLEKIGIYSLERFQELFNDVDITKENYDILIDKDKGRVLLGGVALPIGLASIPDSSICNLEKIFKRI